MSTRGLLNIAALGDREIVLTREFDAPRELVFRAWTTPELLKRWLGVHGDWSLDVCDIDLRVGGAYRYVWRNTSGMEMGMGGVYREVMPPERLVATEKFDHAWYPGEGVGTVVFDDLEGRTRLTQTLLYESRDARDEVLRSPMEQGLVAGFNALADVLATLVEQA